MLKTMAVLRTLGFGRGTILMMILGESLVLALIGGLLGLGIFVLGFNPLKKSLMDSPIAGFAAGMTLFPEVLMLGFGVTILVGLFAGLIPAIRASQRPITEGLRHLG